MMSDPALLPATGRFLKEAWRAYWLLLKILVPALIVVKLLESIGASQWLAEVLAPLMGTMGLPSDFGLVWAAAILTNLYTALVVFYQLVDGGTFTVADVTVLGSLILFSHALPVEGAVAKVIGVPWVLTLVLRIGGAYLFGLLTYGLYALLDTGHEAVTMVWRPDARAGDWSGWLIEQCQLLISIWFILSALMLLLKGLRRIGFERLLGLVMQPCLRFLSLRKEAADVTIIGLLLGLSFGAGLLIDAAQNGRLARREMCIVVCFLGLCHSLVEDTLLILLMGAELGPILLGRVVFSLLLMRGVIRLFYHKTSELL